MVTEPDINKFYCRTIKASDIANFCFFTKQALVDEYLLNDSISDIEEGNLVTTGVFEKNTENLVAFYTLNIEDFNYTYDEQDTDGLTTEEIETLQEAQNDPSYLKSRIKIAFLGVKHDKKNNGVGTYILEKTSRIAKRLSTNDLYVEALYSAHEFYLKKQFQIVNENITNSDSCSILMRKEIKPY